jgi:DNA-binding response OmpR family regulator
MLWHLLRPESGLETVHAHIRYLRVRLADTSFEIETRVGEGYRLVGKPTKGMHS